MNLEILWMIHLRRRDLGLGVRKEGSRVNDRRGWILFVRCFFFAFSSCQRCDETAFVDNYMDYGDDSCLSSFTQGQAVRARDQIAIYRGIKGSKQGGSSSGGGGGGGGGKQHTGRPGRYYHDRRSSFERHGLH